MENGLAKSIPYAPLPTPAHVHKDGRRAPSVANLRARPARPRQSADTARNSRPGRRAADHASRESPLPRHAVLPEAAEACWRQACGLRRMREPRLQHLDRCAVPSANLKTKAQAPFALSDPRLESSNHGFDRFALGAGRESERHPVFE